MNKPSGLNIIEASVAWIAILFPFLIAAGKGPAEIGTTTVAILFVIYVIITKDFRFLKEKWFISIGILWLYLVARSFFTPDIKHAVAKAFPFVRFILFAACLEFVASKNQKINSRIFTALCITLAFLVLDGFIQFFVGHDLFGRLRIGLPSGYVRLTGPLSKQILGTIIATFGIIGIAGIIPLFKKSKHYFWLIFFSFSLIYIIIFLAGERAALLRFLISITLLWLGLFLKSKDVKTKKNLYIIVLIVFVLTLAITNINLLFETTNSDFKIGNIDRQIASSIREVINPQTSSYLFLWKTGMKAGFTNILFGVGPNHFEFFCQANPHSALPLCTAFGQMFFHPHNIWIELFAESGLVGITLFSIFLYELIKKFIKFYAACLNFFECSLIIGVGLAAFQRLLPLPSSGFFKNWYAIPIWFAIGWMLYIISINKSKSLK